MIFRPTFLSAIYSIEITLACMSCWFALPALSIDKPVWALITVIIVSDPDFTTTVKLITSRVINTLLGCVISLVTVILFGASVISLIIALSLTVFFVTSIVTYPTNWRLTPVTVALLLGSAESAQSRQEEIHLALLRSTEILSGCIVSLLLSWIISQLLIRYNSTRQL